MDASGQFTRDFDNNRKLVVDHLVSTRAVARVVFSDDGRLLATIAPSGSPDEAGAAPALGHVEIWQTDRPEIPQFASWPEFRQAVSFVTNYCLSKARIMAANGVAESEAATAAEQCRKAVEARP